MSGVALRLTVPDQTFRLAGPALILAVALVTILLLLRQRITLATYVLGFGVWASLVAIITFTQGVHSPVVMCFPLVIMSMGWVHSIRMALVITALTITATLLLAVAEMNQRLPFTLDSNTLMHAGDQIVVYLITAALITFFVRLYRHRLDELHQLSLDLAQKNNALKLRSHELKRAQNVAHIGSWIYNLFTDQIQISQEASRILDLPPGQVMGFQSYLDRAHPDDRTELEQAWQLALNKQFFDHENRIIVRGNICWVRQKAEFDLDSFGHPVSASGIIQDITQLKHAELALKVSEEHYRTLIEWSPEAILVHKHGKIVYANPAAVRMFDAPYAQALMEKTTTELIHPDYRASQTKRMHSIYNHEVIARVVESKFLRLNNQAFDVEVQGTAIDFDGEPAIQVVVRDITQRKVVENRVHQLAFYDDLTQLPNRRLLQDRLHQAIAAHRRSGNFGAVMFLDLDNFKPLNDQYGHSVGDLLLIEVAQRLKTCVREMDTVARFGGDEFVVAIEELSLVPELSLQVAQHLAEKICASLSATYVLQTPGPDGSTTTVQHHCTASVGVAMIMQPNATPDDLVKWADAAMYQAKQSGRNRFCFANPTNALHSLPDQPANPT